MASIINAATSGGLVTSADTSGVLQLQTASTTAVTVDASQNVGIGTALPGARLQVVSTASGGVYGAIIYNNSATGQGLTVRGGSTSSEDTFNCQTYDGGLALFTVLGNGNVVIPTGTLKTVSTISVGNATPSTSGAGITFPATQSASSNANTLDDYEEGNWTPTFFGTTTAGSPTYNAQIAAYTKIGRSVSVTCYISITNIGGMTGTLQIGGLPFTTMTGGSYYGGFAIAEFDGITFSSGRTQLGLEPSHNATTIVIYNNGSGVSASQQTIANIASSTYIVFSGTYFSA